MASVDICPMSWEFYYPVLSVFADGQERDSKTFHADVAQYLHLSENAKQEETTGGHTRKYVNRSDMAAFHMRKLGWIESRKRGVMQISAEGRKVLKAQPNGFPKRTVDQIMAAARGASSSETRSIENVEVHAKSAVSTESDLTESDSTQDPEATIYDAKRIIEGGLASDILERLKKNSPDFFEEAIKDVLEAMGYGVGEVLGRSGDGGVDGIVNQDKLGLDRIYYQAKRYESNVPSGDIRNFAGALGKHKATRGLFVTTADFGSGARREADESDKRIVLIDGRTLAALMVEHGVGCETETTIKIKKLDDDYFPE